MVTGAPSRAPRDGDGGGFPAAASTLLGPSSIRSSACGCISSSVSCCVQTIGSRHLVVAKPRKYPHRVFSVARLELLREPLLALMDDCSHPRERLASFRR